MQILFSQSHLAERGCSEVRGVAQERDAAAAVDVAVGGLPVEQRVLRDVAQRRAADHGLHITRPATV